MLLQMILNIPATFAVPTLRPFGYTKNLFCDMTLPYTRDENFYIFVNHSAILSNRMYCGQCALQVQKAYLYNLSICLLKLLLLSFPNFPHWVVTPRWAPKLLLAKIFTILGNCWQRIHFYFSRHSTVHIWLVQICSTASLGRNTLKRY